jgi:hypothetical protein
LSATPLGVVPSFWSAGRLPPNNCNNNRDARGDNRKRQWRGNREKPTFCENCSDNGSGGEAGWRKNRACVCAPVEVWVCVCACGQCVSGAVGGVRGARHQPKQHSHGPATAWPDPRGAGAACWALRPYPLDVAGAAVVAVAAAVVVVVGAILAGVPLAVGPPDVPRPRTSSGSGQCSGSWMSRARPQGETRRECHPMVPANLGGSTAAGPQLRQIRSGAAGAHS